MIQRRAMQACRSHTAQFWCASCWLKFLVILCTNSARLGVVIEKRRIKQPILGQVHWRLAREPTSSCK